VPERTPSVSVGLLATQELPEPAFNMVQPVGGKVSNPSVKLIPCRLLVVEVKFTIPPTHKVGLTTPAVTAATGCVTLTTTVAFGVVQPFASTPLTV
jgi:hypothetical protein